jgi:UDP-2,3-diacylglucosamine hydrolase
MPCAELDLPAHWQAVHFVSDLHLQLSEPATAWVFRRYLQTMSADALFILGDLFEVWLGDDALQVTHDPEAVFLTDICAALQTFAQQRALYVIPGNRDFLLGADFCAASGATLLADPCVLRCSALQQPVPNVLLSHGDAWCLADIRYLAFRAQVRQPSWQQAFLQRPWSERSHLARGIRQHSEARKQSAAQWVDLDLPTVKAQLWAHGASTLVHGHTHQAQQQDLGDGQQRWVLSDWDVQASPSRASVLQWDGRSGWTQFRIDTDGLRHSSCRQVLPESWRSSS